MTSPYADDDSRLQEITWSASSSDLLTIAPLPHKTIANITAGRAGSGTLTATLGDVTASIPVTVTSASVTHLKVVGGDNQTGVVGQALVVQPSVQAFDQFENPVPDVPLVFNFTSPAGEGTGVSVRTADNGLASVAWDLSRLAGDHALSVAVVGSAVPSVALKAQAKPGAAAELSFSESSPTTTTAGSCDAFVLTAKDSFGNPAPLSDKLATSVALAVGSGQFFADLSCTGAVTSVALPAGAATATVYYRNTSAGSSAHLSAAAGSLNASRDLSITPANGQAFTLSGPSSLTVGDCAAFTLHVQDAFGNGVALAAATSVTITSNAFAIYADAGCATSPLSPGQASVDDWAFLTIHGSLSLAAGATDRTFYAKTTLAAGQTLTAAAGGFLTGNLNVISRAGVAKKLVMTAGTPLTAATCSGPVHVKVVDQYDNATRAASSLVVVLSASAGGFYSNANCTSAASTVNLAAGDPSATFYFKTARTGSVVLRTAATGLTPSSLAANVTGGAAVKLVWSGAASLVTATCGTYTVGAQDLYGNAVPILFDATYSSPTTAQTIAVGGKGQGSFYSNNTCTTVATSTAVAYGTSYVTFYFKDAFVEPLFLTAAMTGVATAGLGVTTTSGSGNKLVFAGATQTNTGVCSGALTVTSKDSSDAAANVVSATTVTLAGKGSGAFYSNNTCTTPIASIGISAGQSATASFYFKDGSAEQLTLTAAATGLASGGYLFSSGAYAPSRLVLTGPATVTTGACSTAYTVTTQGADGVAVNAVTTTTVNLSGNGSGAFYNDASCTTAVTTVAVASGSSSQVFYYKSAIAETLSMTADATGLVSGGASVVSKEAAAAALSVAGPLNVAPGTCSAAFTVTSLGAGGNPVSLGSAVTVDLTSTATATFYNDANCTAPVTSATIGIGASSSAFYYKSSSTGDFTVTATDHAAVLTTGTFFGAVRTAVTALSANGQTCAIAGGALYCWGYNWSGELGNGDQHTTEARPVQPIGLGSGVTEVAAGGNFTCAIASGVVKCFGHVIASGLASTVPADQAGLPAPAVHIAAGFNFACALLNDGTVWCWGANGSGQLGNNSTVDSLVPVQVQDLPASIVAVAAGGSHSCAIAADGTVLCWGNNGNGQLGDGTTSSRSLPTAVSGLGSGSGATALAAGGAFTCALASGAVQCWGTNSSGQLGDNTATQRLTPVPVQGFGTTVVAISIGASGTHACAIETGGALKCWGSNSFGQLGDHSLIRRLVATPVDGLASGVQVVGVGNLHSCAVANNNISCWGLNAEDELGTGADTGNDSYLTPVPGLASGVNRVVAGYSHSCAVVSGAVYCWGDNPSGQVGVPTTSIKVSLPSLVAGLGGAATDVATGLASTCALVGGGVKCWGLNTFGQLGDTSTTSSATPVSVHGLSSGVAVLQGANDGYFYCVLIGSAVKCWGYNSDGQLGDNSTNNRSAPVAVQGLPTGVTPSDLSLNSNYACAVVSGAAYCWGGNQAGTLGNGTTDNSLKATPVLGLPGTVAKIATGYRHACALVNGGVYCWGGSEFGEVGNGAVTKDLFTTPVVAIPQGSGVQSVTAGYYDSCAQFASGEVQCWGSNLNGKLGTEFHWQAVPTTLSLLGTSSSSVSIGLQHSCAVIGGGAFCWGNDMSGKLGVGKAMLILSPTPVQF